jgi:hypothetical protein
MISTNDLSDDFYEWLKKNHYGKLKTYSVDRHKKIIDQLIDWMIAEPGTTVTGTTATDTEKPEAQLNFEQLKETKEFKWIDLYFSRFEFVPLSDWSIELEQKEIYSKLHYTPFVISISTEKRYFKFFMIKRESSLSVHKITKHKFKILDDESIHDITGDQHFGSYEEMRKHLINNESTESDYDRVSNPKLNRLLETRFQLLKPQKISDTHIIDHFHSENRTKINFTNGSLHFNDYPLRVWSNTISLMLEDFSKTSSLEFDLQTTRETFIIYSLFRISNFFKNQISEDILKTLYQSIPDFPEMNQNFTEDLIAKNIIELFGLCDYFEDRMALVKIIDLFKNSRLDHYEKQNFYDMILVRYNQPKF